MRLLLQIRSRFLFIEDWTVEAGVLLIFLLPPVGILWLFVVGWSQIQRIMNNSLKFPLTVMTFFFLCLMVSTIGAALTAKKIEYGLVLAMLLGYFGLYLRAKERCRFPLFNAYQRAVIVGGCYSVLSSFLPISLRAHPIWGLLLGTKWLGGNPLDQRLVGSEYNPNFASFLLLLSFSLVLSKLLRQKKISGYFKMRDWFLVFLLGYGIVATESRACIATMILIFILFLFRYKRKVGLWVSGVVVFLLPLLLRIIPRSNLIDYSTSVREEIWLNSIRIWEQHPLFGTTPLGFQEAYSVYGGGVPHAHNILLAFFSEYGTIGGFAFVILLLWTGLKYLFVIKCPSDHKKMMDSFILSLPILFFTGLLDHPLSSPQTALVVIPLLSFWDRYTDSLPILDHVAEISSKYLFNTAHPVEYQPFTNMWANNKEKKTKPAKHKE